MKSIFFVACIAAAFAAPEAEAEADPAYLTYGFPATYNYGYHHAAVPAVSAVHSAYVAPTYYSHPFNNVHYLGKRSADAEADPAYLTYGYHPFAPTYYSHAVNSAYVAPTYYSHALNNVHYLGKRSAEAEADPAYVYSGYTPYAAGYTPYYGNYYGGYRAYNRFW